MAIDDREQGAVSVVDGDEAAWLDAHDQAALIDAGECSARELLLMAFDRIERHDPALNAVSHRAFDQLDRRLAAGAGKGPMAGIGWLAKDSLPYVGLPSSFGSRLYAAAGPDAEQFAFADRIDEAGLVALGKSNVPEFSLLPTTESIQLGATSNPWDLGRSAGGSSGGAAAAVAAGLVPVAHAADGGGSIRIPASCCGVVGFKPSREGNLRARGFHLLEDVLVSDAMLSRSVRDTAWFARWLRPTGFGMPAKDGPLTIACCTRTMSGAAPDPAVAATVERTAAICAELGHRVEMLDALPADIREAADIFRTLWYLLARDGVAHCRSALAGRDPSLFLEPWALGLAERAATMDRVETADAYAGIGRVMHAMEAFHSCYDLLLSPVVASPPPPLGDLAGTRDFDALEPAMFAYIGYTPLQNVAGTPSISIPLGWSPDGLPIGSMLSGPFGGDETVLRLAAELEAASPWAGKWPLL